MNYEEFKNELLKEITKELSTNGQAHFEMDTVMGIPTETIKIKFSSDNASAAVGLLPLHILHKQSGFDTEQIASIVLESITSVHAKPYFDPATVIYRLVNYEANKDKLHNIPYIPFYDMAITFVCVISDNAQSRGCMVITEQIMKEQNLTLSQLSDLAHKNTFRIYPSDAELLPTYLFRSVMENEQATIDEYVDIALAAFLGRKKPPMLRISSSDYRYGGSTLLDNKHFEKLSKIFGKNLLVLPSSEQDFVVMPWVDGIDIKNMLECSQEIIQIGDAPILTRNVFCYNANTKKLELIEM